jgi:hypothetical protein
MREPLAPGKFSGVFQFVADHKVSKVVHECLVAFIEFNNSNKSPQTCITFEEISASDVRLK